VKKQPRVFDINLLLKPYEEGGTESTPVKRTFGTMLDWLINKKKYPVDVAGAGLLILFLDLDKGKVFKGDGSYGSPGREMVTALRFICDALLRKKLKNKFFQQAVKGLPEVSEFMTVTAINVLPFFLRPFTLSWWRRLKPGSTIDLTSTTF